ncbi:MAG: hypothetical protein NTU44_06250 [Bacteroidetes bacterium]|nr:hypothetical protein [Bacteroidota bacterium]
MKGSGKIVMYIFFTGYCLLNAVMVTSQNESWKKDEELRMFIRLTQDSDKVAINLYAMNSNMFCIDDASNNLFFMKSETKKSCNLFLKKIDGSNVYTRITGVEKGISSPSVSPQGGEYLAFSYKKGKKEEIFSVNLQQDYKFIPEISLPTPCFNPVFLPMSRKIMFCTIGKGRKPLLCSFDMKTNQISQHFEGQSPSFFPDGRKFVFTRKDKKSGQMALYVFDILTSQESCLLIENKGNIYQPSVSPDGRYIAYVGPSKSRKTSSNYDIYLYDTQNNTTRQLTFHPANDLNPQWSADGQNLYFISDRDSKKRTYNIWKMRAF